MSIKDLFYTKEPVEEDTLLSDSDKYLIRQYPCLKNYHALETFKQFVYHAGRCPECNDYLFPEISVDDNGVYTLVKKCMDRNCDYCLDVSEDFNNHMGVKKPKLEPVKKEPEPLKKETSPKFKDHIPFIYYDVGQAVEIDNLINKLPNCPECMGYDWEISVSRDIRRRYMNAEARCSVCGCVFDVSDFFVVLFSDKLGGFEKREGVESLSDCKMRLLSKPGVPKCTGTLKRSFPEDFRSDKNKEHRMYISGFNY